jgi:di/tricarboxylate transporter
MSNWILVGPVVGAVMITVALVIGYVVVPPIIVQQITEVSNKVLSDEK